MITDTANIVHDNDAFAMYKAMTTGLLVHTTERTIHSANDHHVESPDDDVVS